MAENTPAPIDPGASGGAVESLGIAQPRPEPAYDASAGNDWYLDQTGQLRPNLSPEQLAERRNGWIKQFDRRALEAKAHGRDLSDFSPEARAAWVAKFDTAARADGLNPVEPASADLLQAHRDFGLAVDPKPEQYRPVYGREFTNGKDATGQDMTPGRLKEINTELTGLAAALRFTPAFGTSLIERLVEIGQQLRGMDEDARAAWVAAQNRVTLRRVGSEAALAQLKAEAKAALGVAKGNKFAALIAESPHLNDWWLLATLARHGRAVQAFGAKYPGLSGRAQ
jgi:hypothetical protein